MTTTTATPPADVLDDLSARYVVRQPDEVARFLEMHPYLAQLLIEARPVIAGHFGAETPVVLRVVADPETGNEEDTQLVASITTDLQPEEAILREDRFRDDWWLANIERARCRLAFGPTYRKRPPA